MRRALPIAKQAYAQGRPIRDVAAEETDLTDAELDRLLDAAGTDPGRHQVLIGWLRPCARVSCNAWPAVRLPADVAGGGTAARMDPTIARQLVPEALIPAAVLVPLVEYPTGCSCC